MKYTLETEQRIYKITEDVFLVCLAAYLLLLLHAITLFRFPLPTHTPHALFLLTSIIVLIKTFLYIRIEYSSGHPFPKTVVFAFLTAAAYGPAYIVGRYSILLFLSVLTLGCLGTDYRRILKLYVTVIGIAFLCTVLCAMGGAIRNLVYMKDGYIRSSLGIHYPTDMASIFIYLCVIGWIVWKEIPDWFFLLTDGGVIIISWYIARSSTSTLCGLLFFIVLIYSIIIKKFSEKNHFLGLIEQHINRLAFIAFPTLAAGFLGLTYAYYRGRGFAYAADDLMSSRLRLSVEAYRDHGLHLFGAKFRQIGNGGSTFSDAGYNFIDSSYALILIRYGVILLIVITALWVYMTGRAIKNKNRRLVLGMALIAFHSLSEHHFIDLNFNILLIMPFAILDNDFAGSKATPDVTESSNIRKRRYKNRPPFPAELKIAITIILVLIISGLFSPPVLSWVRTVCTVTGTQANPEKRFFAMTCSFLTVILLYLFVCSFIRISADLKEKRRPGIQNLAWLILCPMFFLVVYMGGSKILDPAMKNYASLMNSDARAVKIIKETSPSRLYVDLLPALYQKKFGGIQNSVFSGEELARKKGITVITSAGLESPCFLNRGFLYGIISGSHAVYTDDEKVIRQLKEAGYHLTGYYSRKRRVNFEKMAELNNLTLSYDNVLELSEPGRALSSGPHINLRGGAYTVTYKLVIPRFQIKTSQKASKNGTPSDDPVLCTLQIATNSGENIIKEEQVLLSQFNKRGACNYQLHFNIPESKGVDFLVIPETDQKLGVKGIIYQQTPEYDTHRIYDKNYRLVREEYYDLKGNRCLVPDGYSACNYSYDKQGNITGMQYYDIEDKLVISSYGYSVLQREYNIKKQITREEYYDTNEKLLTLQGGYAIAEYEYDNDNNRNVLRYYDIDEKPVLFWNCYAMVRRSFDNKHRIIREEAYDIDGKLWMRPDGYAIDTREYDENDNLICQKFFDIDENPITSTYGYAEIHRSYSADKKITREEYYDTDGKPTVLQGGQHAVEYKYDALGNQIEVSYYGMDNQPILFWNSYFKEERTFNEKHQITTLRYFNLERQAIACGWGYAIEEREYDTASNITVQRYLNLEGDPVLRTDGYSEIHRSYDKSKHVIKEEYFGTDGSPILLPKGYSRIEREYDDKGNLLSETYYDSDGNRVDIIL